MVAATVFAILVLIATVPAQAVIAADKNSTADAGSVTITYSYGDQALPNVLERLYLVATVQEPAQESNGNSTGQQDWKSPQESVHFTPTKAFSSYPIHWTFDDSGSAMNLTDESSRQLAQTLDTYVIRDHVSPTYQTHSAADGTARFSGIRSGLYLLNFNVYSDTKIRCGVGAQLVWVSAGQSSDHVHVTPKADCSAQGIRNNSSAPLPGTANGDDQSEQSGTSSSDSSGNTESPADNSSADTGASSAPDAASGSSSDTDSSGNAASSTASQVTTLLGQTIDPAFANTNVLLCAGIAVLLPVLTLIALVISDRRRERRNNHDAHRTSSGKS